MSWVNDVINTVKSNQLLLTGIGLSGAGIITFWIKDVPRAIYSLLRRELTTELVITSQHRVFYEALNWIACECKNKSFRKLKLSNGMGGWDNTITSIGYGFHWIKYKRTYLLISLVKEQANQTDRDKETLSLTKLGRSRKVFDEFVKDLSSNDLDNAKTKIYRLNGCWEFVKAQNKRDLNSIFIESDKKKNLIHTMDNFIKREDWYVKNGIPYQLGILLHGFPGTGKTSLIKAIAAYFNYPIYYISPENLDKIEYGMATLSEKCIVVVEDIDSNTTLHSRDDKKKDGIENVFNEMSMISLSDILNSLDGIFSSHGRILIATTNHIEKLDSALLRPGRIDLKIEVGFVNNEILKQFIDNFYPNNDIDFDEVNIKDNITVAMLQEMVLMGKSEYDIVNSFSKDSKKLKIV